jgi:hypothetical protein
MWKKLINRRTVYRKDALKYFICVKLNNYTIAGPNGCVVWGKGLNHLDAEIVDSNPA